MTTFAHTTQIARGNAKRLTIGSVGKAAAAVAIVGMASMFSMAQLSNAHFAPTVGTDVTHQSDLRDLLCRIDRRCPATHLAAAPAVAADLTHQSDLRDLLCRIDRRCPSTGLATREASRMQTAELTAR
jgi:hypothetical protein